jgi:HSP20 family protein
MSFLTRFDRFDPFEELGTLRDRMDRIMSRLSGETEEDLFPSKWAPTADVVETKDAIIVKVEIPGIDEKDVAVEIENNILTLRGERKLEKETEEKGYRRIERSYGNFSRSFTLPANVDTTKIAAFFNNGLLEVTIPKKEAARPRTINVEIRKKLPVAA